jgi:hypothetical protein
VRNVIESLIRRAATGFVVVPRTSNDDMRPVEGRPRQPRRDALVRLIAVVNGEPSDGHLPLPRRHPRSAPAAAVPLIIFRTTSESAADGSRL